MPSTTVAMVLFPGFTQLDLTGPFEVFARLPETRVVLVAASRAPVRSDTGLVLAPEATFVDAGPADVLFVPGGPGVNAAMRSEPLLSFLRAQARQAQYVTAVCTGALVLGAAGLLRGYRATTHWLALEFLEPLGAIAARGERVVVDRDRITGGGVTAGIDFGLTLAAKLRGEEAAKQIQLLIEYDPAPPFAAGSPRTAPPELVRSVAERRTSIHEERRRIVEEIVRSAG